MLFGALFLGKLFLRISLMPASTLCKAYSAFKSAGHKYIKKSSDYEIGPG